MNRWLLLPFLLLAALALAAYPRLLRFQSQQAAEAAATQTASQLRDGDLIFHTSLSAQSQAIQLATKSPWSHHYDLAFGWTDDRIYCSELIWKVYERGLGRRLGTLQQLKDFDLSHPAVQAKLRERYGRQLPLSEPVISPVSIFNSPELVTALQR
ncbi:hypothetical protein GCM10023185_44350 [Hymenobacter saemangeumensis]|uniref:Peptidoglycan peptidase n=1 Tax=Hymenobacter saemangeumensis TaxID=1084522 RepID=A0ABP8ITG8_9BACT